MILKKNNYNSNKSLRLKLKIIAANPKVRYAAKVLGSIISVTGLAYLIYKNNKKVRTKVNDFILNEIAATGGVKIYKARY